MVFSVSRSDCVGAHRLRVVCGRGPSPRWRIGAPLSLAGEVACERAHGRILQQRDDRQVRAEPVPQLRVRSHEQQRMAAELEEVVVEADPVDAQHGLPDVRDRLLGWVARRDVGPAAFGGCVVGGGQCFAVEFAVGWSAAVCRGSGSGRAPCIRVGGCAAFGGGRRSGWPVGCRRPGRRRASSRRGCPRGR